MPTKIIGTAPYQVPRNSDLGTLATQDADSVNVQGGTISVGASTTQGYFQNTDVSEVKPSLLLDFANGKSLDPRVSFSRSSTGSYYDGKTIVKAEENLMKYSQDFSNAAWTKFEISPSSYGVLAPDGTITAAKIVPSTATGFHYIYQAVIVPASTTLTVSFYAKAAGYNYIYARCGVIGDAGASFNLSTGAVNNTASATATITSVGDGWYRCTYTITSNTYTAAEPYYMISNVGSYAASANPSFAGDGVSGVYLWGTQVEIRSAASGYISTTISGITNYLQQLQTAASDIPRFDHDPITGESRGLLIEESRTNLLQRSSEFDNAAWVKDAGCSVIPNATIAPDGTLTADYLSSTATLNVYQLNPTYNTVAGTVYTFSCYLKQSGNYQPQLYIFDAGGIGFISLATFNLSNGTSTNVYGSNSTITHVGNGWYRCTIVGTAIDTSTSVGVYNCPQVYAWGAQLEAGLFATSYIPTTSAAVSRSRDLAQISGSNFTGFYNPSEGTFLASAYHVNTILSTDGRIVDINDGTTSNRFLLSRSSGGQAQYIIIANNNTTVNITSTTVQPNVFNYYAVSYKSTNAGFTVNGGSLSTSSANGITPYANIMQIGCQGYGGGAYWNGTIGKVVYYPKALTSAELLEITL